MFSRQAVRKGWDSKGFAMKVNKPTSLKFGGALANSLSNSKQPSAFVMKYEPPTLMKALTCMPLMAKASHSSCVNSTTFPLRLSESANASFVWTSSRPSAGLLGPTQCQVKNGRQLSFSWIRRSLGCPSSDFLHGRDEEEHEPDGEERLVGRDKLLSPFDTTDACSQWKVGLGKTNDRERCLFWNVLSSSPASSPCMSLVGISCMVLRRIDSRRCSLIRQREVSICSLCFLMASSH
mmetsp:Transcript_25891/g.42764  ORF Transcript_25891/g.42764 Transcript_25891/m.42764 type:complete len:236 (-) Transcript_25891:436-1143(-)